VRLQVLEATLGWSAAVPSRSAPIEWKSRELKSLSGIARLLRLETAALRSNARPTELVASE
jgi:hypothetical protein